MSHEQVPSKAQVEWTLGGILRRIATGALHPRAGLGELIAAYHAAPWSDAKRFVGEEYGIALLVSYFYSYDDLEERPAEVSFEGQYGLRAKELLDAEVVRLATVWLQERGA